MIQKIMERTVPLSITLLEAMKRMDRLGVKILFVFTGERFEGLLTIGDIQRAIVKGLPMDAPVSGILDRNKIYAWEGDPAETVREKMRMLRAEAMPILDAEGNLKDVWFWSEVFLKNEAPAREPLDLPVVVMAGGKGSRLRPLTNVIPKPLVPIGEKTILEEIMDQFEAIGCRKFFLSVLYKRDMVRFYLEQLEHRYDVTFLEEERPLGTIGSVSQLAERMERPFFVSNCDILIDQDYRDVYAYHCDNRNDLTMVTAVKTLRIPYGVVETGPDGLMTALREKPENAYRINTGVYLMNPELLREIPTGTRYDVTDLMERIRRRGGRIGCFPVSGNAWRDMGEWDEYLKMIHVR
ncbi:MAG: NTP transferase domain-containing protein [Bacteroidales bacterium]|nr:NTP transferase domain-containing protein [Bacteroidales bacterium]